MTAPTHLIMVVNRATNELKLVSAHEEDEAEAAFQNFAVLFANTQNDVHKVTIPTACGFTLNAIKSAMQQVTDPGEHLIGTLSARHGEPVVIDRPGRKPIDFEERPKNGIKRNSKGEYVQRLADGSEIISDGDFSD